MSHRMAVILLAAGGSSRLGVPKQLLPFDGILGPVVDGVIVMLCDQPRVTARLLDALIDRCQLDGACLAATAYGADGLPPVLGAPALFDHTLFAELNGLAGDEGAKRIIQRLRSPPPQ